MSETPEIIALRKSLYEAHSVDAMIKMALDAARELEKQRDAARKDAERLANAMRLIVKPLGDETETSGNPCVSPNPEQGRAIAKALAAHEALTAKK